MVPKKRCLLSRFCSAGPSRFPISAALQIAMNFVYKSSVSGPFWSGSHQGPAGGGQVVRPRGFALPQARMLHPRFGDRCACPRKALGITKNSRGTAGLFVQLGRSTSCTFAVAAYAKMETHALGKLASALYIRFANNVIWRTRIIYRANCRRAFAAKPRQRALVAIESWGNVLFMHRSSCGALRV